MYYAKHTRFSKLCTHIFKYGILRCFKHVKNDVLLLVFSFNGNVDTTSTQIRAQGLSVLLQLCSKSRQLLSGTIQLPLVRSKFCLAHVMGGNAIVNLRSQLLLLIQTVLNCAARPGIGTESRIWAYESGCIRRHVFVIIDNRGKHVDFTFDNIKSVVFWFKSRRGRILILSFFI